MSSKCSSKGKSKTKSSRAMERLKDHNTSPPRPSQSSRTGSSGTKACHSRLSHHSITKSGSRREFSDDSSPERRLSRTRSLDDYRRHYGNRGISSEPRFSTTRKRDRSRSRDVSRSPSRRERVVRPRLESREGDHDAQRHEDRPNDEASSGNANSGVANHESGTPSWGQKLLEYQLRSEKRLEELELFVKNRGQSKDKVVLEEVPAKPAHVFSKKSYQIQSEFNNSVLKKLKDALEADTSEERSSLLEEGIELIKQRNKLLVISDKYGWETGVAYLLDPIAEDSDDERRIKKARKKAKLLKDEKKKQLKSKRPSVKKVPFLGDRNPSFPSMLNESAKGVCRRCGRPGHYARACRAAIPPYRPGPPPVSQQQPGFT